MLKRNVFALAVLITAPAFAQSDTGGLKQGTSSLKTNNPRK